MDPGLEARDFADAGRQIDDQASIRYALTSHDIITLRERFAAWPRTPEAAQKQIQARTAAGRITRPARNQGQPPDTGPRTVALAQGMKNQNPACNS